MKEVGFPDVEHSTIQIPKYPFGSIGCLVYSNEDS